ncbi:hypothetical protein ACFUN8_18510 [Streptomyces sp. NPDC057307]|uniref:hypothetical protein n=1 Tax=Streptomyces sp. NPDC057307 TaxID=3346096 RepID=UPI003629DEE6
MDPVAIMTTAGVIGALIVIWNFVKAAYRGIRKLDDMHGEVMELPAFKKEMREFKAETDHTLATLRPNGGGSIHDKINKTTTSVTEVKAMLEAHLDAKHLHNPVHNEHDDNA